MESSERIAQLEAELAVLKARLGVVEKRTKSDRIVKIDADKQVLTSWAYVAVRKDGSQVVDWSGDVVKSASNLEEVAHDFVRRSRRADLNHDNSPVGEVVESFVFTPEKLEKLGVPEGVLPACGWLVSMHISDPTVWSDVKVGRLRALSIGGHGSRTPIAEVI